jgi:hypothetical protein
MRVTDTGFGQRFGERRPRSCIAGWCVSAGCSEHHDEPDLGVAQQVHELVDRARRVPNGEKRKRHAQHLRTPRRQGEGFVASASIGFSSLIGYSFILEEAINPETAKNSLRRHTGADGSFEWYVLNGHTRRRASNFFRRERRPAAEREKFAGAARPGQSKSAQAKRHIDYIGRCTPFRAQKAPLVRSPRSDAGPLLPRKQKMASPAKFSTF